jgi:hypothetical protein
MSPRSFVTAAVFTALFATSATAAETFAGLSLRVSDEQAPAGSIVQIKIDVTEPKPISTGKGKIKLNGTTTVAGIALMNHDQDTYGVALVNGDDLSFSIHSPANLFGTAADYPILGIAATVASGAAAGTTFPLQLEPGALRFMTPAGSEYPLEIRNGQLKVANVVTIGDVSPGSAIVPAGGTIHISGTNFVPQTRIQLNEAAIAATHYISSSRIDVVLGQTAEMHGMRIRAKNPDNSESTYFSYERTKPMTASNDSILSRAVPLFAPSKFTTATVTFSRPSSMGRRRASGRSSIVAADPVALGIALQNPGTSDVSASIELLDFFGHPYATNAVTIGPDRYLVREVGELFGTVVPPAAIRVTSTSPLQVLGLTADHSADTATAVPAG